MRRIRLDFKAMNDFSRKARSDGTPDPVKAIAAAVAKMGFGNVDHSIRTFGMVQVNVASELEQLAGKNEIYVLESPKYIYVTDLP